MSSVCNLIFRQTLILVFVTIYKKGVRYEQQNHRTFGSAEIPGWCKAMSGILCNEPEHKGADIPTPLNCVRKALILALKDSADAFVQINLALFHTMTEVLSSQYIKFFLLVQQDSFQVLLYPLLPFFCYKGSK